MNALGLNQSLAIAYSLKEDLAQIWQQPDKAAAGNFLIDWCGRARASGIKVLQTMANTLEGHRTGILNWYDFPISTGPLESINNKNGALQRMAFGYRDHDYFIAKLYALHLAKFALIGCRRCPGTAVRKPVSERQRGFLSSSRRLTAWSHRCLSISIPTNLRRSLLAAIRTSPLPMNGSRIVFAIGAM